jgi:tight adherence protein C
VTLLVALGAVLVVALVLHPVRPVSARIRRLLRAAATRAPRRPTEGRPANRCEGLPPDRPAGWQASASPVEGRRAVAMVGVGGAALLAIVAWPPAVVSVVAWAVLAPGLRRRRADRRHQREVARHLPDTVDLLALAIGAGQTTRQAVGTLAGAAPTPFADAFAEVDRRAGRGERLLDALDALPARLGPAVQPMASVLVALERHGVAIGATLEQLSVEARRERRLQAETAARKLPVRLSFPLVCCVLPAFALLTLAPLLAGALTSLRL